MILQMLKVYVVIFFSLNDNNQNLYTMFQISFDETRLSEVVKQAVKELMEAMPGKNEPPPPERKLIHSMQGLADFTGISKVTLQRLKNDGKLPYRQIGRKVIFDTIEILAAMDQHGNKGRKKPRP